MISKTPDTLCQLHRCSVCCRRDQTDIQLSLRYVQGSSARDVMVSEDNPGSRCLIKSSAHFWSLVTSLVFQYFLQITASDSGSSSDTSFNTLRRKFSGTATVHCYNGCYLTSSVATDEIESVSSFLRNKHIPFLSKYRT